MLNRKLSFSLAAAIALAAQIANATPGGLPDEVDAREAADAQLQTQIDQLKSSIGGTGGTASVDCNSGGSINQALATGAKTIVVRGTCNETVTVDRDDVTLQADPAGGEIHGPDANSTAVTVRGHRVTIDGLTVSGGRNGVVGLGSSNLTIRNCTVQATGRSGIAYLNNAGGTVDTCQVRNNPRDGIVIDGAEATVINSTVSNNSRNGMTIVDGSRGKIGFTDRLELAENTISQNGALGVQVSSGATATFGANQVTGNGTDPTMPSRNGIGIFQGSATLSGGTTVSGNAGAGIVVVASIVSTGDGSFGVTLNTISGNGNGASAGGIFAFLGSTITVRNARIESNNGPGLTLFGRSQAQLLNTVIQNNLNVTAPNGFTNPGDGIRLSLGSALLPGTPTSTVSGNAGFGVQCTDGESSVTLINPAPPVPPAPPAPPAPPVVPNVTMFGNAFGDVSFSCTGF
jgi:hypothetical protein